MPSGPAVPVASATPSPLVSTDTMASGSAWPDTLVPPSAITSPVAGSGAVTSGAATITGGAILPAGSCTVTITISPSVSGVGRSMMKRPSAPATPVMSGMPSPSMSICTVAPGSVVPVTVVPSGDSVTPWAEAGGVVSGEATVAAGPTLPAVSRTVTLTVRPSATAGDRVAVKRPSAPAVTVKSAVPSALTSISTVAPASACPVNCVPAALKLNPVAAVGGVVSATGGGGVLPPRSSSSPPLLSAAMPPPASANPPNMPAIPRPPPPPAAAAPAAPRLAKSAATPCGT